MSLIDISVFLIIIGLLLVPLIKSYDAWKYSSAKGNTDNNLASINKAMADFFYENGRYPCPAVITAAPNTPGYGREDCAGTAIVGNVHYGSVPFVSLKIPTDLAIDGWSNRISYTISNLVVSAPFPASPTTNITVRRYNPTDPVTAVECPGTENTPMTNAHFVLVSHGERGVGSYNASGVLSQACPGGASPPLEGENCDADLEFRADICARSDRNDQTYYDDVVYADDTAPSRIWVYSTSTPADATDIVSIIRQVGINTDAAFSPTTDAGVDVAGNILTGDGLTNPGAVISDIMCDTNGNNCFAPAVIGGPATPVNDCSDPSNGINYMRGLWGGTEATDSRIGARVRCQRSVANITSNACTPPQYAIGFSGGTILCGP